MRSKNILEQEVQALHRLSSRRREMLEHEENHRLGALWALNWVLEKRKGAISKQINLILNKIKVQKETWDD